MNQKAVLSVMMIVISMFCTLESSNTNESPQNLNNLIKILNARLDILDDRDKVKEQLIEEVRLELLAYKRKVATLEVEVLEKSKLVSSLLRNATQCMPFECSGRENFKTKVIRTKRQLSTSNVAFTAGLSRNIMNAPAYHNIAFDYVQTNIGNGYNSLTGIFTAPVSGTYVFSTSILVFNDREIFCRIVVNGKNIADTYGRGTDGRLDQGSQTVIVQLQKGYQVSVQNKVDGDAIFGNQDLYSTFSGFLLHQTYSG